MQATEKQCLFVAGIIDKLRHYHRLFNEIMESMPRNNEVYPDTQADNRILQSGTAEIDESNHGKVES